MVATKSLPVGAIIQKFEGKICKVDEIPEREICYAILINREEWMIPVTDSKYINHSCDPNCIIDNDLQVRTKKEIKKGEELTISYNIVHENEDPGPWNPKWSFECQCSSKNCQGIIDKYITLDGKQWYPINLEESLYLKNNNFNKINVLLNNDSIIKL